MCGLGIYIYVYMYRGVWLYSGGEFVVRIVIGEGGFKGRDVFFVLG